MAGVGTVTFGQARELIVERVGAACSPVAETVPLGEAAWRVLAEPVRADRDSPSLARSIRDGFAVRSAELPGSFEVIGEVRAGERFDGEVGPGQTVEIMTGAPVPGGVDQIVMVEHTTRDGNRMTTERPAAPGEFVNPRASEAKQGEVILDAGRRIEYATVSLLATVGMAQVTVYRKPRVAIIATGDEIVPVDQTPLPHQIRNSNAHSLAVQVERAGGVAEILPVAPDEPNATRELIERGLETDLLLLSGGVSAGKYDIVEPVIEGLGAEFYFDRTLIQPGRPTVFGRARGTFFFGLPGNPISTMVTFKVFAAAALDLLAGLRELSLPFLPARLTKTFRHQPGLTRFLPAWLSPDGSELTPISWQGSSDVPAVARANVFLVADAERESWEAGEMMQVMMK
jgi:molybdopterin molybdotransferase